MIVPPAGSSVSFVIPALFKANELASPIWPSIRDNQTWMLEYKTESKSLAIKGHIIWHSIGIQ